MKRHAISNNDFPDDGTFVLAHLTKTNWGKPSGQYYVVVKFIRGLSISQREGLTDEVRKKTYTRGDEWGNNQKPYTWDTHGTCSFFGQEVDYWWDLPDEDINKFNIVYEKEKKEFRKGIKKFMENSA